MKTVHDIMLFMNELIFAECLEDDCKIFNRVRSVIGDEVRDLDSGKLASV